MFATTRAPIPAFPRERVKEASGALVRERQSSGRNRSSPYNSLPRRGGGLGRSSHPFGHVAPSPACGGGLGWGRQFTEAHARWLRGLLAFAAARHDSRSAEPGILVPQAIDRESCRAPSLGVDRHRLRRSIVDPDKRNRRCSAREDVGDESVRRRLAFVASHAIAAARRPSCCRGAGVPAHATRSVAMSLWQVAWMDCSCWSAKYRPHPSLPPRAGEGDKRCGMSAKSRLQRRSPQYSAQGVRNELPRASGSEQIDQGESAKTICSVFSTVAYSKSLKIRRSEPDISLRVIRSVPLLMASYSEPYRAESIIHSQPRHMIRHPPSRQRGMAGEGAHTMPSGTGFMEQSGNASANERLRMETAAKGGHE